MSDGKLQATSRGRSLSLSCALSDQACPADTTGAPNLGVCKDLTSHQMTHNSGEKDPAEGHNGSPWLPTFLLALQFWPTRPSGGTGIEGGPKSRTFSAEIRKILGKTGPIGHPKANPTSGHPNCNSPEIFPYLVLSLSDFLWILLYSTGTGMSF